MNLMCLRRKRQIYNQQITNQRTVFETYNFSLVICRNPKTGKYLAVNENKNRGWWIPGGGVQRGENHVQAALRECKEESGVDVKLKGIISIDYINLSENTVKMRVIYYAEPCDNDVVPKQFPDEESLEAQWVTLQEFSQKIKIRGNELLYYGQYLEDGGQIFPMNLICHTKKAIDYKQKAFRIFNKKKKVKQSIGQYDLI